MMTSHGPKGPHLLTTFGHSDSAKQSRVKQAMQQLRLPRVRGLSVGQEAVAPEHFES